jgi:hypothetical protein
MFFGSNVCDLAAQGSKENDDALEKGAKTERAWNQARTSQRDVT